MMNSSIMDGAMMQGMGGMMACMLFALLFFIVLLLTVFALIKYLRQPTKTFQ